LDTYALDTVSIERNPNVRGNVDPNGVVSSAVHRRRHKPAPSSRLWSLPGQPVCLARGQAFRPKQNKKAFETKHAGGSNLLLCVVEGLQTAHQAAYTFRRPLAGLVLVAPVLTLGNLTAVGRMALYTFARGVHLSPRLSLWLARQRALWQLALLPCDGGRWEPCAALDWVERHSAATQTEDYAARLKQWSHFVLEGGVAGDTDGKENNMLAEVVAAGTRVVVFHGDRDPLVSSGPLVSASSCLTQVSLSAGGHHVHEQAPTEVWRVLREIGLVQ
jgi:hypothetical protein